MNDTTFELPNGVKIHRVVMDDGEVFEIREDPNGNGVQDLIDWGEEQIKLYMNKDE